MDDERLKELKRQRALAWEKVKATNAYAEFQALDIAVARHGGRRSRPFEEAPVKQSPRYSERAAASRAADGEWLSQADYAELALRAIGQPQPLRPLLQAAIAQGLLLTGHDALNKFRSALSRDARFKTTREGGVFYWWLVGEPLPAMDAAGEP